MRRATYVGEQLDDLIPGETGELEFFWETAYSGIGKQISGMMFHKDNGQKIRLCRHFEFWRDFQFEE